MTRKLRCFAAIAVMGAVVALFAGCSVSGGGWLISLIGGGKVTLSLQGTFDTENGVSTGSGEVHDHSKGVNVDAHLDGGSIDLLTEEQIIDFEDLVGECLTAFDVPEGPYTFLFGTYTSQPTKLGPGGVFGAFVVDEDASGAMSPGDFVVIAFADGVYGGYFDCGYLGGGNFQVGP